MDTFFDEYIEACYDMKIYKEIDNFLGLKSRDQNAIVKLYDEGYYSHGTLETKFIAALNVVNYFMMHNEFSKNSIPELKEGIRVFFNKSGLNFEKPFNWFLIACEILSYKRMKSEPSEIIKGSRADDYIRVIEKGREGNIFIINDIKELFLTNVVRELNKQLDKSTYIEQFIGLKKFIIADVDTFITYADNIDAVQFEVDLDTAGGISLGIYTKSTDNKLIILCALSVNKMLYPEGCDGLSEGHKNLEIKDFHPDYITIGFTNEIRGPEENNDVLPARLISNFMKLLHMISESPIPENELVENN